MPNTIGTIQKCIGNSPTKIGDSILTESGTTATITGDFTITGIFSSDTGAFTSDGSGNVTAIQFFGMGTNTTSYKAYAVGTVYTFTNSAAKIAFGTTSPSVTGIPAGTYRIRAAVRVDYVGATITTQNLSLTVKDVTASVTVCQVATMRLTPSTVLTYMWGVIELPETEYVVPSDNTTIELWGQLSTGTGAGTIVAGATGTFIMIERIGSG